MQNETHLFGDDPDLIAAFASVVDDFESPAHAPVSIGLQVWGASMDRMDVTLPDRLKIKGWALSLPPAIVDSAITEVLDIHSRDPELANLRALASAVLLWRLERGRQKKPHRLENARELDTLCRVAAAEPDERR